MSTSHAAKIEIVRILTRVGVTLAAAVHIIIVKRFAVSMTLNVIVT